MKNLTVFEYDLLLCKPASPKGENEHAISTATFAELKNRLVDMDDDEHRWLRLSLRRGRPEAIQVTGHVGVLRTRDGTQIEVLPKVGKANRNEPEKARAQLLKMISCLLGFRHYETATADLQTEKMPLLEVFIRQLLRETQAVVRRGLRSDYIGREDNLFALRGKLLVSRNIRHNLVRPDRFFTAHDEFSPERAENRLLHAALRCALRHSNRLENQRLARELAFVFQDIPESTDIAADIKRIRIDRGMHYYEPALDWAKLILSHLAPVPAHGSHVHAPSLMFPMADLFEAYVAKWLGRKLNDQYTLQTQVKRAYFVRHTPPNKQPADWMQMKPDLLIKGAGRPLVLDTKWKLLDQTQSNSQKKYDISQGDFYQLYCYGHYYLEGNGTLILIYPKTDTFNQPLPVFDFLEPKSPQLKLWVLPFCLDNRHLVLTGVPDEIGGCFNGGARS